MPLSDLQRAILSLLARNRDPESFVAGAVPLQQDGPRYSADIDIFHDREERVAAAADLDAALLTESGYLVRWLRREVGIHSAAISQGGETTRLEWVRDSDFRFFPAVPDPLFGYRLHIADIATNKALAAAGRQAPRDIIDLLLIHDRHLPLAATIWAAVGKDPGFSPESLIAEIRRNARYRADDYDALATAETIDAGDVSRRLKAALADAEAFARAMPAGKEGILFLRDGIPVVPDPSTPSNYEEHAGRRGGYWPSTSEIGHSMLDTASGSSQTNN